MYIYSTAKSIKLCSRKAKNLSNCVKDSVEHLRPFLKSGDLGDNFKVLSFEPFLIEEMKINPSADFLVHLKQVYLKGVSSFGIEKIKVDLKNTTIDVLVNLPVVTFNSKYNMAVKLAVLNIVGDGDCNGTMSEFYVKHTLLDKNTVLAHLEQVSDKVFEYI